MNSQSKKMELLGSTSIPKALLAMGIPTMIGMLVNAFYNLVDAYFVGGLVCWLTGIYGKRTAYFAICFVEFSSRSHHYAVENPPCRMTKYAARLP